MVASLKNIDDVKKTFQGIKTPIFYITNSADRGVGLEKIIPNYHIICIDYDNEVDYLEKAGVKVFCLEKETGRKNVIFRNSALLLKQKKVIDYIEKNSQKISKDIGGGSSILRPAIILFKPSLSVQKIADFHNWRVLNNEPLVSRELEDKLNFALIAKSLRVKTPDIEVLDLARMSYWELKKYYDYFVVQFKSGSAGSSTFFIRSKSDYAELFNKYAKFLDNGNVFPVKVSKFIKGLPITVNACVASQGIYVGEPCFQITGEEACASSKSATCGNDWSALRLSAETIDKIANITETVGRYFKKKNYRGIFGLDFILGERDKDIYLIEFNSRLVASVPFYTKLEIKSRGIPLLALHILEFLDINYRIQDSNGKFKIIDISGAQLVLRNKDNKTCFIAGEFKSGVCRFTENKLEYLRPGYSPEDLASPEELIVLAAPKGRMIMPGSEMAKIESLNSIVSKEYRLRKEISDAAAEIYKKLKPTPL